MSEPQRVDLPAPSDDAWARASQADELLVEGLDQYFSGHYEDAIHVWTRVLFLDRSHARARAYIDRARSAISERQRRSDELLLATQQLLDRGETGAARDLLSQAVASTGEDETASALRLKLERAERIAPAGGSRLSIRPASEAIPGWSWPARAAATRTSIALVALVLLAAVFAGVLSWNWPGVGSQSQSLATPAEPATMPVLSSSEVALLRARTLYGRGRLAEALQALDRVDENSPIRVDADVLRVEIQRLLLASGGRHAK